MDKFDQIGAIFKISAWHFFISFILVMNCIVFNVGGFGINYQTIEALKIVGYPYLFIFELEYLSDVDKFILYSPLNSILFGTLVFYIYYFLEKLFARIKRKKSI